jgi:CRP-like cAMP-binding protein
MKTTYREEGMKWEAERDALVAKRNPLIAERDALRLENVRLRSAVEPPTDKQRGPTRKDTVLERLREGGDSTREIAKDLGVPVKTFSRELWRLARSGKARALARGAYALPAIDLASGTR